MSFLVSVLLTIGVGADALDTQALGFGRHGLDNLEWTPVQSELIELKKFSRLVPYEVLIRETDRGYLIACEIYDAANNRLDGKWDFAEHQLTRFFFPKDTQGREPATVKCIRSETTFPARNE